MKLYLVHCGFYDPKICDGLYESHVNFFVVAEGFEEAKIKAKSLAEYQQYKMHIDGLQEIKTVNGFNIKPEYDSSLEDTTTIINFKHRSLAPKP